MWARPVTSLFSGVCGVCRAVNLAWSILGCVLLSRQAFFLQQFGQLAPYALGPINSSICDSHFRGCFC